MTLRYSWIVIGGLGVPLLAGCGQVTPSSTGSDPSGGATTGGATATGGRGDAGNGIGGAGTGATGGTAVGGTDIGGSSAGGAGSGGVASGGTPSGGASTTGGATTGGGGSAAIGGSVTGGSGANGGAVTGGAAGSEANGGETAGRGGSGENAGAAGFGGDGGPAAAECAVPEDCVLQNDCCTCAALPAGSALASCELDCASARCTDYGPAVTADCVAGQCVLDVDCVPSEIACTMVEPTCEPGMVPTEIDGCYGPCIDARECPSVPSCESCAEGDVCLESQVWQFSTNCIPVPSTCAASPDCACLGPAVCVSVCADTAPGELACFCPGC